MQEPHSVLKNVWKDGFIWLSSPFCTFWPFGAKFDPILAPNKPESSPKNQKWQFLCKNHTRYLKLCGKMVSFGSLVLLVNFWHFGAKFDPILTPNEPKFILRNKNSKFLWKINTQCLKSSGKMFLFDLLGLLSCVWPFGPILALWGPISQKQLGKHILKISA